MKYKLIKPINENYSTIEQILTNRNIKHENIKQYLNTTDENISSFNAFGKDALWKAFCAIGTCIAEDQKALVIVDSDCDGYTASALLINYLYDLFPAWVQNKLSWFIHSGKQHGLSDVPSSLLAMNQLILIPDASSNDYTYHQDLAECGIDIVILDHHEAERVSEHAIVINNQLSDYPNKDLSGVGVVWQFCRYMDELMQTNYANDYLDLVALGMDADMMSMTSIETKHLISKGLKQVQNPFFAAMVDKNSYSMKGKVTPIGVAFYVAPFVNAIVRSGTQEEKELIFNSMLKFRAFDKIPSNKRGHRPGEMEQLYVQAIRTATNVKNRQTRAQDKGLEFLENMIEDYNLLDNKVLLFLLKPGDIDRNIAGLIANKFMAKYQRPCCILTRVEDENGKISYQGSARGCDKTGITEFKDICEQTKRIIFAEGHQGAFGLGIMELDVDDFVEKTNEILKDTSDEALYYVDYIYKNVDVNPQNILDIAELDDLWGKDMDEPQVAIEGLKITKEMLTLMSPDKKPTLKITLPNKVSILKFNSSQEEYEKLYSEHGAVEINLVGSCNRNEWNGYITPQIFIDDYEIVDKVKYVF